VLAELALPIAGLMSDQRAPVVVNGLHRLVEAARHLGTTLHAPFMHMSFLGLSVIPELRLTDQGLVDVGRFELVPVVVE
jgi:adenine deaminase